MSEYEFKNIYGVTPQEVANAQGEAFRSLYIWSLPSIDPKEGFQQSIMPNYHYIPDIFQLEIVRSQFPEKVWLAFRSEIMFDLIANRGPTSIDVKFALRYDPEKWIESEHKEFTKLYDWMRNHFGVETTIEKTRQFFTEQLEISLERKF